MNNLGNILHQVVCIPSQIPDDWSFLKLRDICSPKQWRTISSSEMTKAGYPVFGANGFVGFYPEYNHEDEAVAITCRGNTCGTINKIPPKTYITGNSMALDDIKATVVAKNYLYYALKYRGVGDSISGSAQPQITGEGLRSIEFPAPPLPEQQKIASILSSVDNVIEKTRAQIDKLKDLKTGMMQELLTKGIGHTEFKDSPVGMIPVNWSTASVENYSRITTGTKDTKDRVANGKYPFFVRSQKVESINSYSFDGEAVLTAGDGVGTGKVFHYINGRFDFHQRVYKISDFSDQLDGKFFFYYFSNSFIFQVNRFSAKGSVDSVRMEMIAGMQIPLPPILEQKKIAEAIQSVDVAISTKSERLDLLGATKKAMMQDLLTGKVRVKIEENEKESAVA